MKKSIVRVKTSETFLKLLVINPSKSREKVPGILWIHGGGYIFGTAKFAYFSCAYEFAKKYGAVVISPSYRLAGKAKYPAAFDDCCAALKYMWNNADDLGIDKNKIMVGGESAGGGLAVAVCLFARDQSDVKIAMQMPLYPMLDASDTDSSFDNHGKIWNTKRNHYAWRRYLGGLYGQDAIPEYCSPAKATDLSNLPPCYTYVCEGEPFYCETLAYVKKLQEAGVSAALDVFPGDVHAFDILKPNSPAAKEAKRKRTEAYERIIINGENSL